MTKCSHCGLAKNIVYRDYAPGVSIKICYSCLIILDWKVELADLLPNIMICPMCAERYLPKKQNSIRCPLCWIGRTKITFKLNKPEAQTQKCLGVWSHESN